MRIAFAGTPEFARIALQALLDAGHEVVLVLTQADRPAGRGMKLQASPVKQLAQSRGIAVCQPLSLRLDGRHGQDAAAAQGVLAQAAPELMVVAAYGLILPVWALTLPPRGCLNIHASLLPRWRGAAPIHRAIEAGDTQTGITIMQMDEGLDTGAMLLEQTEPIAATDTTGSLHDRLAVLGGRLIVQALQALAQGGLSARAQPAEGVSYAHKIDRAQAQLDWSRPAALLERQVRAFNPAPGAATLVDGEALKVWTARVAADTTQPQTPPGTILGADAQGLRVACGEGVLELLELQRAGARRLPVGEFLRGLRLQPGQRLGTTAA